MGRSKYVVVHGILGWGVPMGIVATGYSIWMSGYTRGDLIIAALVWTIGGIAIGRIRWSDTEQRYLGFRGGRKAGACQSMDQRPILSRLLRGRRRSLPPFNRYGFQFSGEGLARSKKTLRLLP
jgi:hypothetical protein